LAVLPAARRDWTWRTFGVGAIYAATLICFVAANKLTTAANTIFLQATAPLYVLFVAPWLLRERVRRHDLLFMAALATGMACFFMSAETASATAPHPALGNGLALASGIGWAGTIIGLRSVAAAGNAAAAATVGTLLALLVCLPAALPVERFALADGLTLLFLGTVQIGLAYVLLISGVASVAALEASLLLLLEPVLNPLWAWLVQGERPGPLALSGGAVILSATAWHAWFVARLRLASSAGEAARKSPSLD
jgi:drug/metabolite transporter (DMT)-like permease